MSHTFQVSDLAISEYFRAPESKPWHLDRLVQKKLRGETLHASAGNTVGGTSPLFHAVSYAFNSHCPLVLTPDAVWLTLLIGLSHHIDADPEKLRRQFVSHEGKKTLEITVQSPSIRAASPHVWESGIREFSKLLHQNLNAKRHELIVCNFSTTTETDRLASEVVLMGAMKHWFEYKMVLACGISRVTVAGIPADWRDIINRVRVLEDAEFDLGWWTEALLPVLLQIEAACEGRSDIEFWKRAYLRHPVGSGGDFNVSGWINVFHPYVVAKGKDGTLHRNPFLAWESNGRRGLDPDHFPFGLSSVPVKVDDHGTEHDCEFYGGLVGVSMSETDYEVRPTSGFAIQLLPAS